MLDTRFANEHFSFFRKTLFGVDTPRPRETSCLRALDRDLRDALGPAFVAVAFTQEDKQRTLEISKRIQAEMRRTLMSTSWITEPTRRVALAKMDVLQVRLGHPEVWRDYSALDISRDSWAANAMAASIWEFRHQLAKIGRPPAASDWLVSSTKVNAYHNPRQITLFISAAMLAPPIFDRDADDAMNYGGMGALIGHELTHGFDGVGRRYDQRGVLIDWWTAKDDANFNERARCMAEQYSQYEVLDGVRLNGEQTLAENISDAAGVRLAYAAYKRSRAKPERTREGFTPEQRFFLSYATGLCEKATDEFLRDVASGDTHSWAKYRVNGVVSNLPEFQEAFGCRKGQAMVREQMCRVW